MTTTARRIVSALCALVVFVLLFAITADAQQAKLENPLDPAFSTVSGFIAGFLRAVVMISMPIITLFIVYSGFLFVTARGNQEQISRARKNFFWVIIGAILILGAWVLATLIGGTVTQLVGS